MVWDVTLVRAENSSRVTVRAVTYFIGAMAVILNRSAEDTSIFRERHFRLVHWKGLWILVMACLITMRTEVEREVAMRFEGDSPSDLVLTVGAGIDHGTWLV